jgi:hypothetical protein
MLLSLITIIFAGLLFHFAVLNRSVEDYEGYGLRENKASKPVLEEKYFSGPNWF